MVPLKAYEQLSELVKMYPYLYNKKDFKKKKVKQRAWKEIDKELDLENGKVVEQLWNNLKNLLSKQRTKLKEVDVSVAAADLVNKVQKALEELNYFSWLFRFVKVRKTKSNLSLTKEGGEEDFDEDQYEDERNKEDENNEDESNEGYNDEDQYEANELENSLKKSTEEIAEKQDTPFLKRKLTGKMEKTKLTVRKCEKSEIEEEEFKALQVIDKLASGEENKGECEIFGELIATELETFSQKQRLLAKHEIQNVLFKIRMQSLEFNSKNRPTKLAAKATM